MNLDILSIIIAIAIALTVHEFAHAWMANYLGDPTAKYAGRVSLNPIRHLDPIGTLVMIFLIFSIGVGFGWGKPVPVNPYNLRHRYGELLVSLVGPLSNFIIAFVIVLIMILIPPAVSGGWSISFHNLIDFIVKVNIILGIFNLIPIPPLDGSKILFNLLTPEYNNMRQFLEKYGIFLLIFLVFFGGGLLFATTTSVFNALENFEVWANSAIYLKS